MDRRCPLCPGSKLGSEAHLYLSCPLTSSMADPLIAELRTLFPWDVYTQHQQMAVLVGTMPQVQHHKQWFMTILPRCHALAVQLTLTVQKELQISAVKAGMTASQLRAALAKAKAKAKAKKQKQKKLSVHHRRRQEESFSGLRPLWQRALATRSRFSFFTPARD
jgi:hypothetical protein